MVRRHYLSIVGPAYGFFGVAMALYFASQGTGEMYWPVAANLTRIAIAAGGSALRQRGFWGSHGFCGTSTLSTVPATQRRSIL